MLLQAIGITKSYGVHTILSNIQIQINERERIGLVGVNGAGKSTLLQIVAGEMSYDAGEIFKAKETRIGYLAQNSGLQSEETIWKEMISVFADVLQMEQELRRLEHEMASDAQQDEARMEAVMARYSALSERFREAGGYETEARVRSVLHGMGFAEMPPETTVQQLSGGQKTRLALAKLLLQAPDLLILDEPTNHLDIATLSWLESYLRAYSGALLVVSHDRYFLDAVTESIVEIERTTSRAYTGNYSKYIELKAAEYESELKKFEKQQDEIARMEDFIRRNLVRASTTKRAQSRRKALDRMDRLNKPQGDLRRARFAFEIDHISGKDVLRVQNLAVSYDRGTPLFSGVDFYLNRGETVALIGPNGIGKSTLLKALVGGHEPDGGTIVWGTNVQIGYYDQEQRHLTPSNSVLDEVWNEFRHMDEAAIRTVLGNFLFSGDDVKKKIAALSGGEKARVSLAKLMLQNANLLILDEPTNHLDLYSKEVLEAALMDFEGTLLFISHDRYFLNKMAERIIELTPQGAHHFLGNYDDYLDKKNELVEIEQERLQQMAKQRTNSTLPAEAQTVTDYEAEKQAKREERGRQRKIEALEQQIEELEAVVAKLEQELTLPEVYQDYILLQEKQAQIEEAKTKLQHNVDEWAELQE